jgi:hypothetical protein
MPKTPAKKAPTAKQSAKPKAGAVQTPVQLLAVLERLAQGIERLAQAAEQLAHTAVRASTSTNAERQDENLERPGKVVGVVVVDEREGAE